MSELEEFNLEEMAKRLGIEPSTLQNRIYAGKDHPPYYKPKAGEYRFPVTEFLRWRNARMNREVA